MFYRGKIITNTLIIRRKTEQERFATNQVANAWGYFKRTTGMITGSIGGYTGRCSDFISAVRHDLNTMPL